ncbi:zinc ribbon domain-containing protein [Baekduia sp. Peel2402]|uniref:zinc ribbon domain-containing protein n=1 Tax=Baekduia sp. Peel2402 TaxID=3458296 RepID=UPI00403E36BA
MTLARCPSCGAPHGAQARYCIHCGQLLGERSVDLDRAFEVAREREAEEAAAVELPAQTRSIWRRPAASALVSTALALGVLGGLLIGPDGRAAGRAPVLLGGAAAPAAAAASIAEPATTAVPPATEGTTDLTPSAGDDTTAAATGDATAAADDDTTAADTAASDDTTTTDDTTTSDDGGTTADNSTSDDGDGSSDLSGLVSAASKLPPIKHVWVIAVSGPLAQHDGSYLGETLWSLGTVLTKYGPGATDPLAGAQALVGGKAPTLARQLKDKNKTAKVYASGDAACARNPFAAVASDAGEAATCADAAQLTADLGARDTTPELSYILPDPTLDVAGLDRFLEQVVGPIRRTETYKSGGLIAIVPTATTDASATTGALLLSPFAAAATTVGDDVGPGVLLRTVEDLFGLDPLGAAAADGVSALDSDVLAKP